MDPAGHRRPAGIGLDLKVDTQGLTDARCVACLVAVDAALPQFVGRQHQRTLACRGLRQGPEFGVAVGLYKGLGHFIAVVGGQAFHGLQGEPGGFLRPLLDGGRRAGAQ